MLLIKDNSTYSSIRPDNIYIESTIYAFMFVLAFESNQGS